MGWMKGLKVQQTIRPCMCIYIKYIYYIIYCIYYMSKYISKVLLKMFQECFIQYFLRMLFARSKKKREGGFSYSSWNVFFDKVKSHISPLFSPINSDKSRQFKPQNIQKTSSFRPPPFKTCNCICAVAGRLPLWNVFGTVDGAEKAGSPNLGNQSWYVYMYLYIL